MATGRDATAVKIGPGRLYIAPIGTTEPTNLSAAPAAGWVDLGYTEEGSTMSLSTEVEDVEVAEEFWPVDTKVVKKAGTVSFNLAQDTAFNLSLYMNGPTPALDGGNPGQVVVEDPTPGTEIYRMLLWEDGATPATNTRRRLFRKVFQTGDGDVEAKKAPDKTQIPMEFTILKPASANPTRHWYAAALSGIA